MLTQFGTIIAACHNYDYLTLLINTVILLNFANFVNFFAALLLFHVEQPVINVSRETKDDIC